MDPHDLLADLDPEQREAAAAPPGPVCILAGAGTGKTRTITRRIAFGVASGSMAGDQVLAVTFTARAAGELRDRLRLLGCPAVQARTFHAAALRQLTYFGPRVLGAALPSIAQSKAPLVAQAASRQRLAPSRTELRDLIAELEWAASSLISAADYPARAAAAGRTPPVDPVLISRLATDYAKAKDRAGVMDFEDLLLLTTAAIEEHPDVAAEVRARYRHFVVDEYQDVTPLQQRVLDAWLGGRDSVTVVGDTAQTIYSFAGADARLLTGFPARHPGAVVVRLVRDYRSSPQVVAVANRLLRRDPTEHTPLQAAAPDGPVAQAFEVASEPEEARQVARRVGELIAGGTPASEVAVLFRINAMSQAYEQALAEAGVAYLVRGGERFFDRPEIREATLLLRAAARSAAADAPDVVATVTETLRAVGGFDPAAPPGGGAARERWENLSALCRLAQAPGVDSLPQFVAILAERADAAHAPTVEGVTLASLHAAKGLEWQAVFLVGLVEGSVPIVYAATPEQVAEERRLLYVGVTRARERLCLSWALSRTAGGRQGRHRSRFLDEVLTEVDAELAAPAPPTGRRASRGATPRCRVCGRPLAGGTERVLGRCTGCPSELDAALFERLRAWRSQTAGGLRQPAFCVFTDATLTAIAETRPASRAALAAIPGIGATKLERWGAELVDMCTPVPAHAGASPTQGDPPA